MDLTRSLQELLAENVLLRQQLIVASRKVKRSAFRARERGVVVLLSRLVHKWRDAVLLVKPDTILRWHREGFRLFWRWKSHQPGKPQPCLPTDVIVLGERHMKSVLEEYSFRYFNTMRPHQGLAQRIPVSTRQQICGDPGRVMAVPVLGRLHHDYCAAA